MRSRPGSALGLLENTQLLFVAVLVNRSQGPYHLSQQDQWLDPAAKPWQISQVGPCPKVGQRLVSQNLALILVVFVIPQRQVVAHTVIKGLRRLAKRQELLLTLCVVEPQEPLVQRFASFAAWRAMKQVILKLSTHQKDVPGELPEIKALVLFLRRGRRPCAHRHANYWVNIAIGGSLVIVPVYAVPFLEMVAVADTVTCMALKEHCSILNCRRSSLPTSGSEHVQNCELVLTLARTLPSPNWTWQLAPSSRQGAGVVILPLSGAISACFEHSLPQHSEAFVDHFGHESLRRVENSNTSLLTMCVKVKKLTCSTKTKSVAQYHNRATPSQYFDCLIGNAVELHKMPANFKTQMRIYSRPSGFDLMRHGRSFLGAQPVVHVEQVAM